MSTARAPSASILTTSRPVRTPPSTSTSASPPTASTTSGSARTVEGTESSWRPPWLETTIPSTPASTARRASSASSTPFTIRRPSQCSRTQAMSSQVTLGSNCASTQSRNDVRRAGSRDGLLEVAERQRLAADADVADPARVRDEVEPAAQPRHAVPAPSIAVAGVAVARADDRQVDRQHQDGRADGPRARHQLLGVAAVAHHVELEPGRLRARGGDLLDAADRDRRLDERDPGARPPRVPPAPRPASRTSRTARPARGSRASRGSARRPPSPARAARRPAARSGAAAAARGRRRWRASSPPRRRPRRCSRTAVAAAAAGPAPGSRARRGREAERAIGREPHAASLHRRTAREAAAGTLGPRCARGPARQCAETVR